METPTVSMPKEMLEKIDSRRGNTPRSEWIRGAIRDRLEADAEEAAEA